MVTTFGVVIKKISSGLRQSYRSMLQSIAKSIRLLARYIKAPMCIEIYDSHIKVYPVMITGGDKDYYKRFYTFGGILSPTKCFDSYWGIDDTLIFNYTQASFIEYKGDIVKLAKILSLLYAACQYHNIRFKMEGNFAIFNLESN